MRLEIKNVTKNFGGLQALNSVDLTIDQSQIVGLIGPNGAGKTTLTNVIDGVYKPSRGQVWFNEERIDPLPPYLIARRGVGRTFQVTRAFRRMTVMENMMVPALALNPGANRTDVEKKGPRYSRISDCRTPSK